jgi:hypothetical protein
MAYVLGFDKNTKVRQLVALATQGSISSSWVAPFTTGESNSAVFMFQVGTIGAGVSFAVKLRQAQDSAGTGAKDITGATISNFTETEDERIRTIEIGPGALDDANGFTYVQAVVTATGGTAIWGANMLLPALRYPGIGSQHATYDEYVIVAG